ncbi:MAG TPA: glycosyltransferase family 2 protein, partial [Candidatus Diapherotrites archaeon]|nr:glycosyltransferase family 2 protein [Candidatus Diapherotrites archaeon]
MSKKSTASVIVITFNRLSLLQACLASLRQQTVKGFETVVVNNGCTDGTPKWLSSRQGLSVVNLPLNAGVAAARNAGVQAARGAVLVFVDDDCTMPMDWLETLLAGYASEEVSGVGGTVLTIPGQPSWFEGGGVNRFGSVALVHAGTP